MNAPLPYVIVGGGVTGLAAAYFLQRQRPHAEIHLIEASSRVGGLIQSSVRDGFLLESGPDCFLSQKDGILDLCPDLALENQVLSTRPENRRSFIVRKGQLHPIPEGYYLIAPSRLEPFLKTTLLSWPAKWRVLAEALIPKRSTSDDLPSMPRRTPDTGRTPWDESLASFVRRRLGKENLKWLAQPLLAGIYAADPETLSLRSTFPQFIEMEAKYGSVLVGLKKRDQAIRQASGARYSLFSTFRGGMQTLTDRLREKLSGVTVRLKTRVTQLEKRTASWELTLNSGETIAAAGVCLAVPAYCAATLLEPTDPQLSETLASISYTGAATLNLAYDEGDIPHPLNGFGFVAPHAEQRTTLACTFAHRKFEGRAPAGKALLRAFVGGALQENLLRLEAPELERRVRADLKDLLGITAAPLFTQLSQWPQAMPQYTLGHLARVLQIEDRALGHKGLALAGNWSHGVGVPDSIASARRAAETLAGA